MITIHTDNHDACGEPRTRIIPDVLWDLLQERNKLTDESHPFCLKFLNGTLTTEEGDLWSAKTKRMDDIWEICRDNYGLNKWDFRTRWFVKE